MHDPSQLPEPLSPPDCDLRGNQWLPFHGAKFFASDFDASASDAVFRAFINLMWAAWNQVPAGSLPNIPAVLCKLAGCGRDLATWETLVAGGVLHGFALCRDGRLYHKFLAAEAVKAYDARLKADKKREADRNRLKQWRDAKELKRVSSHDGNASQNNIETPEETSRTRQDKTRQDNYPNPSDSGARAVAPSPGAVDFPHSPPTPATALAMPGPPPASDARTALFNEGLETLISLTGRPQAALRSYCGKALKSLGDDAAVLLAIIREAKAKRPADPLGWITAAAKARASPPEDTFLEGVLKAAGLSGEANPKTIDHEPINHARLT